MGRNRRLGFYAPVCSSIVALSLIGEELKIRQSGDLATQGGIPAVNSQPLERCTRPFDEDKFWLVIQQSQTHVSGKTSIIGIKSEEAPGFEDASVEDEGSDDHH
jgi:hypothetical protein